MKRLVPILLAAALASMSASAQSRIASDFEIAQMQRQLATSSGFVAQLSARLNLGDARRARSESASARAEYERAFDLAEHERLDARRAGALTRYATATSYAALTAAKLAQRDRAFTLAEEAVRYESGSAKSWNLHASVMSVLGFPAKAAASASNAVTIAAADLDRDGSLDNRLDLVVYEYALAGALADAQKRDKAVLRLRKTSATLDGAAFSALRRDAAARESFEVYSTARGNVAAYLSLVNRVNLRLGALLEIAGDTAAARQSYARVLQSRSDDSTALAGLGRLSGSAPERERYFAEAFDANPFDVTLVREYQQYASKGQPAVGDDSTTGGKMRRAILELSRGDRLAAARTLESLRSAYPANDTITLLLAETARTETVPPFLTSGSGVQPANESELSTLIELLATDRLSAEQRVALDAVTLTSDVVFDSDRSSGSDTTTDFASGQVGRANVRFAQPFRFTGRFSAGVPLRLTFRVLGATRAGDVDALLIEPVKLEAVR